MALSSQSTKGCFMLYTPEILASSYASQVEYLNNRLLSKELTLKEYTEQLAVVRSVFISNIEKYGAIKVY
jgi:hypothetical protein